jgi:deoxycytidine triphosphate deaminase
MDRGPEWSPPVSHPIGDQVWVMVSHFPRITDSGCELGRCDGRGVSHNWTKRSIFWGLPNWHTLLVRHNIDIIYNEMNVFDNVFNTVIDVKGKIKDNLKARRDLEVHCHKHELLVLGVGEERVSVPKACYSLIVEAKKVLLE